MDPIKATYFQNLWYFWVKIQVQKIPENLAFFLIEAEVEAMGQKWEFGPEKKFLIPIFYT